MLTASETMPSSSSATVALTVTSLPDFSANNISGGAMTWEQAKGSFRQSLQVIGNAVSGMQDLKTQLSVDLDGQLDTQFLDAATDSLISYQSVNRQEFITARNILLSVHQLAEGNTEKNRQLQRLRDQLNELSKEIALVTPIIQTRLQELRKAVLLRSTKSSASTPSTSSQLQSNNISSATQLSLERKGLDVSIWVVEQSIGVARAAHQSLNKQAGRLRSIASKGSFMNKQFPQITHVIQSIGRMQLRNQVILASVTGGCTLLGLFYVFR